MTRHFTRLIIISLPFVFVLMNTSLTADEPPMTDRKKSEAIQKMYHDYQTKFPEVLDISADNAMELADQKKIIFVDIRKSVEQAVSMLPNAITEKMLLEDPTLIKNKTAVAYCTIGYRSGVLAEKMVQRDIHLTNLAGGILAWVHAGGKVYDNHGETQRIHVFGKTWDYAPQGYETVMFGFFEQILNSK